VLATQTQHATHIAKHTEATRIRKQQQQQTHTHTTHTHTQHTTYVVCARSHARLGQETLKGGKINKALAAGINLSLVGFTFLLGDLKATRTREASKKHTQHQKINKGRDEKKKKKRRREVFLQKVEKEKAKNPGIEKGTLVSE
jgi:hypothetical protein